MRNRNWQRGFVSALLLLGVLAVIGLWTAILPRTQADNVLVARNSQTTRPDSTTSSEVETTPLAPSPAPDVKPEDSALWLDVDLSQQSVTAMQGDQEVKAMVTSSGASGQETPQGTFEIQNRGEWFYSPKYAEGARWWVSFKDWGVYLFHSVVMDENQQVIPEEADKLGTAASHGCLRLAVEDAKWIYDNVPEGAKVVIHA